MLPHQEPHNPPLRLKQEEEAYQTSLVIRQEEETHNLPLLLKQEEETHNLPLCLNRQVEPKHHFLLHSKSQKKSKVRDYSALSRLAQAHCLEQSFPTWVLQALKIIKLDNCRDEHLIRPWAFRIIVTGCVNPHWEPELHLKKRFNIQKHLHDSKDR